MNHNHDYNPHYIGGPECHDYDVDSHSDDYFRRHDENLLKIKKKLRENKLLLIAKLIGIYNQE